MDEIQKVLVKAGRKDLARDYYHKITAIPTRMQLDNEIANKFKWY